MRYLVAVSGGVDSVVLLDMLVKSAEDELIVAHFDHGIRSDSADDARFVEALANSYGLPFISKREELGAASSEMLARERRYAFLRIAAKEHRARIVTAHHQDDVLETIIINIARGTGWRGLAVMGDKTIERPLLAFTKKYIYNYALKNQLEWVEDRTNMSDKYLRNRVRRKMPILSSDQRSQLVKLHDSQIMLADQIDEEALIYMSNSRYFLTMIDEQSSIELLRTWLHEQGVSLTRPQRLRMLHAIKTAKPGHIFEAGADCRITFTSREFIVKHPL